MSKQYQDLAAYKLPRGFRGRPAWLVQLWWLVEAVLFTPSPQVFYGWRRFLLRLFGARVGKGVIIRPSATVTYPWRLTIGDRSWIGDRVTLYTLGEIIIGDDAVVSQHSYICTGSHDHTRLTFDIWTAPIRIQSEAWLATNVFVGPGVTIGSGAVVGASSVVMRDVPAGMICAGNPLRVIRPRGVQREHTAAFREEEMVFAQRFPM